MILKRVRKTKTMKKVREIIKAERPENNPAPLFHGRYYVVVDEGKIKGVVALKRRSWYLTELRHLVVLPEYRESGIAKMIVQSALAEVKTPLACCTIREDNPISLRLFSNFDFHRRAHFRNGEDSIWFLVYQKPDVPAVQTQAAEN